MSKDSNSKSSSKLRYGNDGLYWAEGDKTPFCPNCKDEENREVHLVDAGEDTWECRSCYNTYDKIES